MSEYIIKFSSDKVTTSDKNLAEERKKEISAQVAAANSDKDIKNIEKFVNNNIQSKRFVEKLFLKEVLQLAFKDTKDLSDMNVIMTLSSEVEEADEHVIIDSKEFEKHIREKAAEVEKKPWMILLKDLIKQIISPIEFKTSEELKEK